MALTDGWDLGMKKRNQRCHLNFWGGNQVNGGIINREHLVWAYWREETSIPF